MKSLIRRGAIAAVLAGGIAFPLAGSAQAALAESGTSVKITAAADWEFIAAFPTYQQCVDAGAWYGWTSWYCAWNTSTYDLYALY